MGETAHSCARVMVRLSWRRMLHNQGERRELVGRVQLLTTRWTTLFSTDRPRRPRRPNLEASAQWTLSCRK